MKKFYACLLLALITLFLVPSAMGAEETSEKATFAGGCFWCMEVPFEEIEGVLDVVSGYAGGKGENPTYENYVSMGFVEVVQVTFDPSVTTYEELLDIYWRQINPTDSGGQFCDRGAAYRPVIYYHSEDQLKAAEASRDKLATSGRYTDPITTEITSFTDFYPAEEYHQDYHKKNPIRYKFYRFSCGRDQYLDKIWKNSKSS